MFVKVVQYLENPADDDDDMGAADVYGSGSTSEADAGCTMAGGNMGLVFVGLSLIALRRRFG